jgi:hypothetical protein
MTQKCSCGYKIRGKNHENGEHHKQGKNKDKKKKVKYQKK